MFKEAFMLPPDASAGYYQMTPLQDVHCAMVGSTGM